jgi:hypothetical protein
VLLLPFDDLKPFADRERFRPIVPESIKYTAMLGEGTSPSLSGVIPVLPTASLAVPAAGWSAEYLRGYVDGVVRLAGGFG